VLVFHTPIPSSLPAHQLNEYLKYTTSLSPPLLTCTPSSNLRQPILALFLLPITTLRHSFLFASYVQ
jgi:hypothetical protein